MTTNSSTYINGDKNIAGIIYYERCHDRPELSDQLAIYMLTHINDAIEKLSTEPDPNPSNLALCYRY